MFYTLCVSNLDGGVVAIITGGQNLGTSFQYQHTAVDRVAREVFFPIIIDYLL